MRPTTAYWVCQTAGWSGIAAADFFFRLLVAEATRASLFASLAVCGTGLVATHAVRFWIRRHDWLGQPLRRLAPRIALAALGVGTLLASVGVLVAESFRGLDTRSSPHAFLWLTCVGTGLALAWTALYLAFAGIRRSQRDARRRLELDLTARLAELGALQAQLDPHFLFNSLNSIRALIGDDPERARDAVTKLSSWLREASAFARRAVVSLDEELRCVDHYLALESMRYEDLLRVEMDVEVDASTLQLPARSLQTLVENGVKHGVARSRPSGDEGGKLRVQIFEDPEDHDRWRVRVQSPGPWRPSGGARGGIGLANLRQRLHILYGTDAELRLAQEDRRVIADLSLPIAGSRLDTQAGQSFTEIAEPLGLPLEDSASVAA